MLIASRVSEPMESDVPPCFPAATGPDDCLSPAEAGTLAATHEHHHPAMTTYNTTVMTVPSSPPGSRPKSPVYIHRCPFQNCTHGRYLQPEADLGAAQAYPEEDDQDTSYQLEEDLYHNTHHQEPSSAYTTSIPNQGSLHMSSSRPCQGCERQDHQRKVYGCSDYPGCNSPVGGSGPCEAAEPPLDQWYSTSRHDSSSYMSASQQDAYTPTGDPPRLLSRGLLDPSAHLKDCDHSPEEDHQPDPCQQLHSDTVTGPRTTRRIPKVSMGYRQRAIDCMLRQLRVSSDSSDPSTIQVIKQTVNQLEDQLYHHAQTKDEYQLLVASKLYAILQQLAERQQRSFSPERQQSSFSPERQQRSFSSERQQRSFSQERQQRSFSPERQQCSFLSERQQCSFSSVR